MFCGFPVTSTSCLHGSLASSLPAALPWTPPLPFLVPPSGQSPNHSPGRNSLVSFKIRLTSACRSSKRLRGRGEEQGSQPKLQLMPWDSVMLPRPLLSFNVEFCDLILKVKSVDHMHVMLRGLKGASDPLKLELQTVVSYHAGEFRALLAAPSEPWKQLLASDAHGGCFGINETLHADTPGVVIVDSIVDSGVVIVDSGVVIVDSRVVTVDSGVVIVDSRVVIVDSGVVIVDSRVVIVDSRVVIVDSGLAIVDSGVVIVDSRVAIVDSRVAIVDSGVAIVDSRVAIVDSGVAIVDSGVVIVDSGLAIVDRSVVIVDSGLAIVDSGVAIVDSGVVIVDSGVAIVDSGVAIVDSRVAIVDSGLAIVDSGVAIVDSGLAIVDSGLAIVDSRVAIVDSSVAIVDSGVAIVDSEIAPPAGVHTFNTGAGGAAQTPTATAAKKKPIKYHNGTITGSELEERRAKQNG
ncbi:hypothetical protein STEG23_009232 [Scotinomys teguina]